MKNRFLSLVLSLALLLALLPAALPRASAASVYPVWVGGIQVTDDNKAGIPVSGGSAQYDPAACTLTLTDVTGVQGLHTVSGKGCIIYAKGVDLTIKGKASLTNSAAAYGIFVSGGTVTLRGEFDLRCSSCALRGKEILFSGCGITAPGSARIYSGMVYQGNTGPAPYIRVAPSAPVITAHPADVETKAGDSVTFRVTAVGLGLKYQWQSSTDAGKTWKALSGKTQSSLKFTVTENDLGSRYRCVVSNAGGTVRSSAARLSLAPPPTIEDQPKDTSAKLGASASFRVQASGSGLSYQWQYSLNNGNNWTSWNGKTAATLQVTGKNDNNGCLYRCKVSSRGGSVLSEAARLVVTDAKPAILVQPTAASVTEGGTAVFRVVCAGSQLQYQWQYSADSGTNWSNLSGKTSAALPVSASLSSNGCLYRCKVTNPYGSVVSSSAKLTVKPVPGMPSISAQPADLSLKLTQTGTFKVSASGTDLSYQWYYCLDNGSSWKVWNGKTEATLQVTGKTGNNGCLYRCEVRNSAGTVTTRAARLTVTDAPPVVLTQPKDMSLALGSSGSFAVTAFGSDLSYQWYYCLRDTSTWKIWNGKTSPSLQVTGKTDNNGCLYRCKITDSNGSVTTRAARLTCTNSIPTILTQPQSVTVPMGTTFSFHVTVWGSGLKYQWYYSLDKGANWSAWSGRTSPDLEVTARSDNNGCLYRCFIYNVYGVATSATAKLTVSGS